MMTACGGNGSGTQTPSGNNQTAPPAQLNVTTADFKFEVDQESVPAGWVELIQENTGKAPHEVQMFRLNEGVTFQQFKKASKGPGITKVATTVGGTAGTAGISTDRTQAVTLELEEGSYALICFVQGHNMRGMIAPFEVTAPEGEEQAEPVADDTIKAADFELFLPEGFTGQGTYAFENAGPAEHEITLYKVDATLEEAEKYLAGKDAFRAPPPGGMKGLDFAGGAAAAEAGITQYVTLDLEPGVYIAACFVPDKKGPHAFMGMAAAFEVT